MDSELSPLRKPTDFKKDHRENEAWIRPRKVVSEPTLNQGIFSKDPAFDGVLGSFISYFSACARRSLVGFCEKRAKVYLIHCRSRFYASDFFYIAVIP